MRTFRSLILVSCLLWGGNATADPIVIPLPLDSPVSIDVIADPIVTFGERTIDFTPVLNQEFIAFLIAVTPVPSGYRNTIGARARDGLSLLSGSFPASPDPTFVNQLPSFSAGTMNLLAFDLIIPGCCTPFSLSLVDLHGDIHHAGFSNPVPEPASFLLAATGLGILARRRRRASALVTVRCWILGNAARAVGSPEHQKH
jgi:hypothetical protein